ncbi:hypothetical protein BD311DRAFT_747456 [Dichomitus squalens]|uniref:Uncharacterized protein n=1 Tax=Dichomitus squalens TaxID=114155 RepID=A0A4V2K1V5_9APHY|nr:hypothetical protein BD311DRAFT_747456 [Dichomitus squalens]
MPMKICWARLKKARMITRMLCMAGTQAKGSDGKDTDTGTRISSSSVRIMQGRDVRGDGR